MSGVEERHTPFLPAAAPEGRAKVFMHGGSQAVRLPKAFRVEGGEVRVTREGDRIILEPVRKLPHGKAEWDAFWAKIDGLSEESFPERPPQLELRDIDLD